MATPILIKRSAVAGRVPLLTDLALGELGINTTDGKLFLKRSVSGAETILQVGPQTTSELAEGSNLYYTDARAQAAVTTVTGNAGTATLAAAATRLATARTINGVGFDGTAAITVTAAAGTLSGATLASGVTASSLTTVGTLQSLSVAGANSATITIGGASTSTFYTDVNNTAVRANSPSGAVYLQNNLGNTTFGYFNTAGATITGIVSASSFTGAGTGLTGTAAGLTAGSANALTAANSYTIGALTVGNISSLASDSYRIVNSTGFVSGFDSGNITRTGYLQFNAGTDVRLAAESANAISIRTDGGSLNITADGNTTVSGGLTVGGDLTVNGTTTTINATNLAVADLNITVGKNATTAAAANGAGLTVAGANATIVYTSANDSWTFNKPIVGTLTGTVTTAGTANALNPANAYTVGDLTVTRNANNYGLIRFSTATADSGGTTGILANPNGWTRIDPNGSSFLITNTLADVTANRTILNMQDTTNWTTKMALTAAGNLYVAGTMSASGWFIGAGTGLTGTAASLSIGGTAASETLATVTGRNGTTSNFITVAAAASGNFITAYKAGATYSDGLGAFLAKVDNPNGSMNTFFQGVTAGTTTLTIRADGSITTAGSVMTTQTEGMRIINSGGFISGHNGANNTRTGYLQFNAGANVQLTAENNNNIAITSAGGTVYLGNSGGNMFIGGDGKTTFSGMVAASGAGGFASTTYVQNARNPIWRFGTDPAYGLSYFQGTSGVAGADSIGFHFGTATTPGSTVSIAASGLYANNFTGNGTGLSGTAANLTAGAANSLNTANNYTVNGLNATSGINSYGLLNSTNPEAFRITNPSGYISGFNAAGNSRTGYLQFNNGSDVRLVAENSAYAFIGSAGGNLTIAANGNSTFTKALNVNGLLTTATPSAYTAITQLSYGTAAIQVPQIAVPNNGANNFAPMIQGSTQLAGAGYNQHYSIGGYRNAVNSFAGGLYVGVGGNDNYPTEFFTLGMGGAISHSGGTLTLNGTASNALTANKLNSVGSNWNDIGVIDSVVGQLSWKNYGNGHTIFDASNGVSPNGTTVNNTNSQSAWAPTYPTLMGWNGSDTFGVRVDMARWANGADSATTAGVVNMSSGRTDPNAYPVVWGVTGATSQLYSASAVTITSSTGTLSATNLYASSSITVTASGSNATLGSVASSWGGSTQYPTLYGSTAERWVMHINPHVSYTQPGANGYTGSMIGATIRMAANPAANVIWDIGIGTNSVGNDKFSIGRTGSSLFDINNVGGAALAGGLATNGMLSVKRVSTVAIGSAAESEQFSIRNNSSGASMMSFHREGVYAINMGLDTDNVFRLGGWSDGTNVYRMQVTSGGAVYANTFNGVATSAKYADLAENYAADAVYPSGTVVMFGGDAEITLASADTKRVAGIVSTNPAHLMNDALEAEFVTALALQGRVPCFVIGPVAKGDMMVSAGNGFAKANNDATLGQVIGKALGTNAGGEGVIEVVVGRG